MMKRIFSLLLALALFALPALAEEAAGPEVTEVTLELMGCSVRYPQLTGLDDPQAQSAVNAAIMEAGEIQARISRMAALMQSPVKMQV